MILLIQGEIGVGKTTLIRRLLGDRLPETRGFWTRKEAEGEGFSIYIHPMGQPPRYGDENRVGRRLPGQPRCAFPEAFQRAAVWLEAIPTGGVTVLDELGVLEEEAPRFQQAVVELMCRSRLVLAAVKPAATPFLDRVRSLPGARLCLITPDNRDELYLRLSEELSYNS